MDIKKEDFKDNEFMSSREKYVVAKLFKRFVENGFKEKDFSKKLYEHLHLHCGFIAHYNKNGFYYTYFNGSKDDLKNFVEHFLDVYINNNIDEYNYANVNMSSYKDINKVMADILIYNKIEKYIL